MLRWELLVICWLSALALELLFELLFALELLFIIHPHGAVEFLKMRCCWCALLVICWLSARLCPGIMIADMYWQFCTEWQDRLITVDMYWQFCAEWQDRPGIITLEIMRAPRADTGQWSS